MIAIVPVRAGRLPAGADAVVTEASGRVLVIGEDPVAAAASLRADVVELRTCEAGAFAAGSWSEGLAQLVRDERVVVLPGSPDGRDLAGRLAAATGRTCHAWCTEVTESHVVTTRLEGAQSVTVPVGGPIVATLVPFAVPPRTAGPTAGEHPRRAELALPASSVRDATVIAVDEAAPGEVDLADADRIAAGGVGLGGSEAFDELSRVATALRASLGATRPVTDRGIVDHERQIGTTGVAVSPTLYLAFGISGAVQHTAGIGHPDRIVSVNTDPSCPMSAMADLAVVADAEATVRALARRLGATA